MADKWKIKCLVHTDGDYMIVHLGCGRHWFGSHFSDAWPFRTSWVGDKLYRKHHCMDCDGKAPDHLIMQLELLNGK